MLKKLDFSLLAPFRYKLLPADILILILAILTYWDMSPVLYSDDWPQVIEGPLLRDYEWIQWGRGRPFLFVPFGLQSWIFGARPLILKGLLLLTQALSFQVLLRILNRLEFLRVAGLGLPIVLLCIVYPSDFSRTWLNHMHYSSATLIFALSVLIQQRFVLEGRVRDLSAAIPLAFLSLLIYEGHWGLWLGILCLYLVDALRRSQRAQSVGLSLLVLSSGFYWIWRVILQPKLGTSSYGVDALVSDPLTILGRLLVGLKVSLVWAWTHPLSLWFPEIVSDHKVGIGLLASLILGLLVFCLAFAKLYDRSGDEKTKAEPSSDAEHHTRRTSFSVALAIILLGISLTIAGYIPVVAVYLPSLSDVDSRVNQFAAIGASIAIVGCLYLLSGLVFGRYEKMRLLCTWVSLMLFLVIGFGAQRSALREQRSAWNEQLQIWNQLSTLAPGVEENTSFLFVLHGFEDRNGFLNMSRRPLAASWDASSAVRILYDDQSLAAGVLYPDLPLPETNARAHLDGVELAPGGPLTSYSATLVFEYHVETSRLEQIVALDDFGFLEGDTRQALCPNCILEESSKSPFQHLFELDEH